MALVLSSWSISGPHNLTEKICPATLLKWHSHGYILHIMSKFTYYVEYYSACKNSFIMSSLDLGRGSWADERLAGRAAMLISLASSGVIVVIGQFQQHRPY